MICKEAFWVFGKAANKLPAIMERDGSLVTNYRPISLTSVVGRNAGVKKE